MTPTSRVSPFNLYAKVDVAGWVFAPLEDFICFVVPVLFASMISVFGVFGYDDTLLAYVWFVLFLDQGHVFATYLPIHKAGQGLRRYILPIFIFSTVLGLLAFTHSVRAFFMLAAYASIFHSTRQHFGWLRLAQKKSLLPHRLARFEELVFWSMIIYPILHWHSQNTMMLPNYMWQGDLLFPFIPSALDHILQVGYWCLIGAYMALTVYRIVLRRERAWGRLLFIFMTWFYFYVGICILGSQAFILIALMSTHGLSYHFFIYGNYIAPRQASLKKKIIWPLCYFSIIAALGLIVNMGYRYFPVEAESLSSSWQLRVGRSVLLSTAMAHYIWDTFIWRNQARVLREGLSWQSLSVFKRHNKVVS